MDSSFLDAYSELLKHSLDMGRAKELGFKTEDQQELLRLENVLKLEPSDVNAQIQVITVLLKSGYAAESDKLIEVVESEAADNQFLQFSIARLFQSEKLYARARSKWDSLRVKHPGIMEPLVNLASIDIIENQFESALSHSIEIQELAPDNNKSLLIRARAYHKWGKWEEAVKAWRNVINIQGANFETDSRYATALYYTEDFELLNKTIEDALSTYENKRPFQILKIRALIKTRQFEDALAMVDEIAARQSEDHELLSYRYKILFQLERYLETESACKKILRVNPADQDALTYCARASQSIANQIRDGESNTRGFDPACSFETALQSANECWKALIHNDAENELALAQLSNNSLLLKNTMQAESYILQLDSLSSLSRYDRLYELKAKYETFIGNHSRSIDYWRKAIESGLDRGAGCLSIANQQLFLGDTDAARATIETAEKSGCDSEHAALLSARCHMKELNWRQAIGSLENLDQFDDQKESAIKLLHQCYASACV